MTRDTHRRDTESMPTNTDTHFPNGLPRAARTGQRFMCDRALLVVDRFTADDGGPTAWIYLRDGDGWSCRGRGAFAGMRTREWVEVPDGVVV